MKERRREWRSSSCEGRGFQGHGDGRPAQDNTDTEEPIAKGLAADRSDMFMGSEFHVWLLRSQVFSFTPSPLSCRVSEKPRALPPERGQVVALTRKSRLALASPRRHMRRKPKTLHGEVVETRLRDERRRWTQTPSTLSWQTRSARQCLFLGNPVLYLDPSRPAVRFKRESHQTEMAAQRACLNPPFRVRDQRQTVPQILKDRGAAAGRAKGTLSPDSLPPHRVHRRVPTCSCKC